MSGERRVGAPPPPAAIVAIGLNTFREAIRDRILYVILAFTLALIAASRLLSLLTVGDEDKIIKDLGLSAISICGVLTSAFVGVSLVFKEIERRTVYTLLANPVRRWQFVIGKFSGLMVVLSLNIALMSVALLGVLAVRGVASLAMVQAIILILVEVAVVTAFALLFSTITKPILAAMSTFAVYVSGHLSWGLRMLGDKLGDGPGRYLCELLYWVAPNLSRLNIKAEAVHGLEIPAGFIPGAIVYGFGYSAIVLAVACLAFERRDFQ